MKVALVHDWLTGMRGGEKVLEALCELYPDADIFTLIYKKSSVSDVIAKHKITTSFLQLIPGIDRLYRYFLPLLPLAAESLNLKGYDLIISSSHCVVKGVKKSKEALHICYCHSPMRYVWDMQDQYFNKERASILVRAAVAVCAPLLRFWDKLSAKRVDYFVANSKYVAQRITRCYGREADVIYPPVDTDRFRIADLKKDYYIVLSAFAPYKRVDLAVEAFNELGLELKIIGAGQDEARLKTMANDNIQFLGRLGDEDVNEYLRSAKALIFPGEEDFGIVPVESMASGTPVIAFARGGALETVLDGETGLFFAEQTVAALKDAVLQFEETNFSPAILSEQAKKFDKSKFMNDMRKYIEEKYVKTP